MNTLAPLRRREQIIWLAGLLLLVMGLLVAGLMGLTYWLLLRTGEDAYATILWKRAAKKAGEMETYIRSFSTALEQKAANRQEKAWPPLADLARELSCPEDVLALERLRADGQPLDRWTAGPGALADAVPVPSADVLATLQQQGAYVAGPGAQAPMGGAIALYLPLFEGLKFDGALRLWISTEQAGRRWLPKTVEPLICEFWLWSETGRPIAGASRSETDWPRAVKTVLRAEPLITEPDQDTNPYRVVAVHGTPYLVASAPVHLPGVQWQVEVAMPYNSVRLAPRTLFKTMVIIHAWILPLVGILLLFGVRLVWVSIEARTIGQTRRDMDGLQARLVALIEQIAEPVYLADAASDTSVPFASQPIEALTGYAAVEMMAHPELWLTLVHPDDRERVRAARETARREKTRQQCEYRLKHRLGHWVSVRERLAPVCDSDGALIQILGVLAMAGASPPARRPASESNRPETPPAPVPAPSPGVSPAPPTQAPRHILLADDDRLLVNLFSMGLKKMGFGITPAYDGLEAVELYQADPARYNIVVLDMVMPRMSGLEAIPRLKTINPHIKIIGISGYSRDGKEWRLPDNAVAGFLPKPFELEDLVRLIRQILGS